MNLKIEGYTVYLVKCADGSYYSGMCVNMKKELIEINNRMWGYFKSRPDRVPVTVVFREDHVPFKEAYVKHKYLRSMTRRSRELFLRKGRWPLGKILREFVVKTG